jgi:hypothetical protein
VKILVSGCSISSGYGFADTKDNPLIWPNQLAKHMSAEVTNISIPGYDNVGIVLGAIREFTTNPYDVILIQLTSLNRVVVSPNIHGAMNIASFNSPSEKFGINQKEYYHFFKTFVKLNHDYEHWKRLINCIIILQNLKRAGYNIHIINGIIDWNQDFFEQRLSNFSKRMIDFDNLPDEDIAQALDTISKDKSQIDLAMWINPFDFLVGLKIDQVTPQDKHPGPKSHQIFTNLIFNYLKETT